MLTLLSTILVLSSILSVLAAPGVIHWDGSLATRQGSSDFNSTMFPDYCLNECVAIGQVFSNCGMDAECRCTEENAAHLSDCMNCWASYTDDPNVIHSAEATLSEFNSQCASANVPISVTFALTATSTQTELPMITPSDTSSSDSDSVASTSSPARRVIRGAIAGGVIGGIVLIALSLWWYFLHRKPIRKSSFSGNLKERPFYRLEETGIPLDLAKKAQEDAPKT